MYERLAVCMWASVSMRRAALCAASVSSWGGTVRNARVLHVACRLANTARLRATSFAWGLRRPAICGGSSWSRRRLLRFFWLNVGVTRTLYVYLQPPRGVTAGRRLSPAGLGSGEWRWGEGVSLLNVGLTRTRAPTATPEDDRGEKAEPRRYAC